jgi:serine/threonine protein phosphatase PrpC
MARDLKLAIGQYSDRGRKEKNQDFHGAILPDPPLLGLKGIAIGLADGISSSDVGGIAAESAIKGFLTDYYCTSESWSVKTSAQRVIAATNSWLHAQSRRGQHAYDKDKGYVCTLTVLVAKSRVAHIFHIGDARVYRVSGQSLEQLTTDHRVFISPEENYLGRALGVNPQIEIDYQAVPLEQGDVFVLVTDGVYEHVSAGFVAGAIGQDLDASAKAIAEQAYNQGSPDNLTVQIVRVAELPDGEAQEILGQATELPLPPLLEPRMAFDGYLIRRQIHASSRSHIYLAIDTDTNTVVTIKIPSIDLRGNADYLRRFMMEEWVARRIDSPHVLKPCLPSRKRNFLYTVMEFVEGQTLTQWMTDNPRPDLETVRGIVEQIAAGLRAFHRLEMLHQDLRPDNIMIDKTGTVKIIDFGSTRIAGVAEAEPSVNHDDILGTVQYTAPEYLSGDGGSPCSDLFSLGVIAYQMLTGRLPYGADMAKTRTQSQQRKIPYRTIGPTVPVWIDRTLRKAVHPDPHKRYGELSELTFDLRHPNPAFLNQPPAPLIERNPLLFWQILAGALVCIVVLLLIYPARP